MAPIAAHGRGPGTVPGAPAAGGSTLVTALPPAVGEFGGCSNLSHCLIRVINAQRRLNVTGLTMVLT